MDVLAYAKINLLLRVGEKRADGYHEIESVMQSISLHDSVSLQRTSEGRITLSCNLPFVPTDERNLAVKAADLFFRRTGTPLDGLSIRLRKNIPVGAGLGGGSSDAAAVLRALDKIYRTSLDMETLTEMAVEIGADAAFFLRGGTQLACGIGEKLSPLPSMPDAAVLIVKPSFSVSTPKAYAAFDSYVPQQIPDSTAMRDALDARDLRRICACLANSLEAPVAQMHPKILQIRDALLANGAIGARMSGAGSAVFGIFASEREAEKARAALPRSFGRSYLCRPVRA